MVLGLIIGFVVGCFFGLILMALMVAAGRDDKEGRDGH